MSRTSQILILMASIASLTAIYLSSQTKTSPFLNSGLSDLESKQWSLFKENFNKIYDSPQEEALRQAIFKANFAKISAHNSKPGQSYQMGINQLADLTHSEYIAKLKLDKPLYPSSGIQRETGRIGQTNDITPTPVYPVVPSSVDWVKKGAVGPVMNQGQCGSSSLYASLGAIEALQFIQSSKYESLSLQQLIDCVQPSGGCDGGEGASDVYDYVSKYGLELAGSYPGYPYYVTPEACKYNAKLVAFKIKGGKTVTPATQTAFFAALATQPLVAAVDASQFQFYSGGIFNETNCGATLDSEVLVVGYTPDYVNIQMSWGASFGENGYIRLAVTGGSGMCGIYKDTTYPY